MVALVEAGVDVNQCKASNGNTLLHVASQRGDAKIVSALMTSNASLTLKNRLGQKPIDVATNVQIKKLIDDEMTARFDHGLKRAIIPPPPAVEDEEEESEESSDEEEEDV